MSADLGELGRQAEARRSQRATPGGSTVVKSPRLGVPASKVGNNLRNVELAPRLSLSRSAVTRLALTRLAEQMSPTDIAELLNRDPEHKPASVAGRKRR